MKLSLATTAAFVLSTFGVTDAARIEMSYVTGASLIPYGNTVLVGDDGKRNNLGDYRDGCRNTKFDFIKNMCIDDGKLRAHINYSSGLKRCFRRTSSKSKLCGGSESCYKGVCSRCWDWIYTQSACNW